MSEAPHKTLPSLLSVRAFMFLSSNNRGIQHSSYSSCSYPCTLAWGWSTEVIVVLFLSEKLHRTLIFSPSLLLSILSGFIFCPLLNEGLSRKPLFLPFASSLWFVVVLQFMCLAPLNERGTGLFLLLSSSVSLSSSSFSFCLLRQGSSQLIRRFEGWCLGFQWDLNQMSLLMSRRGNDDSKDRTSAFHF